MRVIKSDGSIASGGCSDYQIDADEALRAMNGVGLKSSAREKQLISDSRNGHLSENEKKRGRWSGLTSKHSDQWGGSAKKVIRSC